MTAREAKITINGTELTEDQSIAVRMAVTVFAGDLAKMRLHDGGRLFGLYSDNLNAVLKLLLDTPQQ